VTGPLASLLAKAGPGLRLNERLEHEDGELVFRHACKLGLEGIVSKRKARLSLEMKNPDAPAAARSASQAVTFSSSSSGVAPFRAANRPEEVTLAGRVPVHLQSL
jgi:hypothetical protein